MNEEQQKFLIQEYLEAVLDHFHDGIYITDGEANTVYLNHSYELISGLQKSEMMGKNMRELVDRGVISKSGTLAVLEKGEVFTSEQSFRTGKRAIITSTPVFSDDENNHLIMVVTIVREITEIYAIRKELKRKEQMNRNYLNQLERIRRELEGNAEIVAADPVSVNLIRLAERLAMLNDPVFISGEPGSGKTKIAEYIHSHSQRAEHPFVSVSLAAYQEEELLMHLYGNSDQRTNVSDVGILESAQGGTLYLEDVSEISFPIQKVVYTLLTGKGTVGRNRTAHDWNIRFIISADHSLEELRQSGKWNPQLLEVFSLFPLTIVPLRQRKEDIVPLLHFFLNQYNRKTNAAKRIDRNCYLELMEYHWPGNVRELANLVQRAAIISEDEVIQKEDFFAQNPPIASHMNQTNPGTGMVNLKEEVARLEASYMQEAFQMFHNTRDAAKWLGIDSSTFVRKRQRYIEMNLMKDEGK